MPGNPRYQPKSLVEFFGYDNLYGTVIEVELATLWQRQSAGNEYCQQCALVYSVRQLNWQTPCNQSKAFLFV